MWVSVVVCEVLCLQPGGWGGAFLIAEYIGWNAGDKDIMSSMMDMVILGSERDAPDAEAGDWL